MDCYELMEFWLNWWAEPPCPKERGRDPPSGLAGSLWVPGSASRGYFSNRARNSLASA